MPRVGRIALAPTPNEAGKLIGDFTVARVAPDRFFVWGSSAAQIHHMRWFEAHLPGDGSVAVERLGMGSDARRAEGARGAGALADHDVSNAAFRFMDHRTMDVAGCPGIVNRLSYTGDLGYEILGRALLPPDALSRGAGGGGGSMGSSTSGCGRSCRCGWRRTGRPGSRSSGRYTGPSRAAWSAS